MLTFNRQGEGGVLASEETNGFLALSLARDTLHRDPVWALSIRTASTVCVLDDVYLPRQILYIEAVHARSLTVGILLVRDGETVRFLNSSLRLDRYLHMKLSPGGLRGIGLRLKRSVTIMDVHRRAKRMTKFKEFEGIDIEEKVMCQALHEAGMHYFHLKLSAALQRPLGVVGHIRDRGGPLFIPLAITNTDRLVFQVDILPAQRHIPV